MAALRRRESVLPLLVGALAGAGLTRLWRVETARCLRVGPAAAYDARPAASREPPRERTGELHGEGVRAPAAVPSASVGAGGGAASPTRAPTPALEADGWRVEHTFGEGVVRTAHWTRRYSVGPVTLLNGTLWPPSFSLVLTREVDAHAPDPDAGARCGDSLRVRFVSSEGLFAPTQLGESSLGCGRYRVVFRPPPVEGSVAYALDARLLHVEGEGLAEPHAGLLGLYVRDEARGRWGIAQCNASCAEAGPRYFNADLRISGALTVRAPRAPAAAHAAAAAACERGDADGAWLRNADPAHPAFAAEPWAWVPYGCALRHYSARRLRQCVGALHWSRAGREPALRFFGESTLMDVYRAWLVQMHAQGEPYHWPRVFPTGGGAPGARNLMRDLMSAASAADDRGAPPPLAFAQQHGSRMLLQAMVERSAARPGGGAAPLPPSAVAVLSQGHNDMMKTSHAEFRQNLFHAARLLRAWASEDERRRLVWVTAPPRHYKEKHAPGHTECRGGRSRNVTTTCLAPELTGCTWPADVDTGERAVGAAGAHRANCDARRAKPFKWFAVLMHNTLPRIRRANADAVRELRATLGDALTVVDGFKVLEPLGPEYSLDGVHWACEEEDEQMLAHTPGGCRALGNAAVANLLANVVCNRVPGEHLQRF